jgi:hypothetical protein
MTIKLNIIAKMVRKTLKTIIFFLIGNLLYLFFYSIIKNRSNKLYVLNYHATYPNDNKSFTKQIIFLKKHFDFINEKFLLNKNKINCLNNKPKILLTFDDGHISNLNILKILEEYKIYSLFFIPYEFINRKRKKNVIEENITTNKSFNIISDIKKLGYNGNVTYEVMKSYDLNKEVEKFLKEVWQEDN